MISEKLANESLRIEPRPVQQRLDRRYYDRFTKRVLDILICLIFLPFILVAIVLITLIIYFDSRENPFFIQERVGKNGRRFRMYKFRTMPCNHNDSADRAYMQAYVAGEISNGNTGAEEAAFKPPDRDITRAGQFLRRTSLDELPQVLNVLRGEMSLIGPRPNVPYEVEKYSDWHRERLNVLPGITGLAQVNGRSNIYFDEITLYDIYYVRHVSLELDFKIFWRTIWVVLSGWGAG